MTLKKIISNNFKMIISVILVVVAGMIRMEIPIIIPVTMLMLIVILLYFLNVEIREEFF